MHHWEQGLSIIALASPFGGTHRSHKMFLPIKGLTLRIFYHKGLNSSLLCCRVNPTSVGWATQGTCWGGDGPLTHAGPSSAQLF